MRMRGVGAASAPVAVGGYSQAVDLASFERLLFVSGQIPEDRTGRVPVTFEEQAALVWSHVVAQLEAGGMTVRNLVKVTTFLSSRRDADANGRVRRAVLGDHAPALTVVVAGIFDERWLLEIEAIAAA